MVLSHCFYFPALNPLSCQAYKNVQSVQQKANIMIDVDGSGPLNPFPVTCEFYCKLRRVILCRPETKRILSLPLQPMGV